MVSTAAAGLGAPKPAAGTGQGPAQPNRDGPAGSESATALVNQRQLDWRERKLNLSTCPRLEG